MSGKPFSIRLPQGVQKVLEAVRHQREKQLDRAVPTSEIVQQFLEHPPRIGNLILEVAALENDRTASLEALRLLIALGEPLSPARALFLVQLVHESCEQPGKANRSNTDWLPVVRTFDALIQLPLAEAHQPYYLSNLGIYGVMDDSLDGLSFQASAHELLVRHEHLLTTSDWTVNSEGIARCLAVALRDEALDERAMNETLKPHWPGLLQLAIRGHVATTGHPLKIIYEGLPVSTVARINGNGLELQILSSQSGDLSAYIGFEQSGFTLGSFGDLLALLRALGSPSGDPERKFVVFDIKPDRVCIGLGSSRHYVPASTAQELTHHIQAVLDAPEHTPLIAALKSAYGE